MYPLPAESMIANDMIAKLSHFVGSLDAYEPGCPFLIPTYGNGDIPQSFARMAAVHGAIQILGCSLDMIESELSGKSHVLVSEPNRESPTRILHAVVASHLREQDPKNVSFEVFVDTPSEYPIFCITIPHTVGGDVRPGTCPPGTCLRHYVRIVSDVSADKVTVTKMISQIPKDELLFSKLFTESSYTRVTNYFFGMESHIDRATRIFDKLMNRDAAEPLPVPPTPTNPFEEDTVE